MIAKAFVLVSVTCLLAATMVSARPESAAPSAQLSALTSWNCTTEEACTGQIYQCPAGSPCHFTCSGQVSCFNSRLICPPDRECLVDCYGEKSCNYITLQCAADQDCVLHCSGDSSCNKINVFHMDIGGIDCVGVGVCLKPLICTGTACPPGSINDQLRH